MGQNKIFQELETIRVAENVWHDIKIGDQVLWDFENARLTVRDIVIWNIPFRDQRQRRYYGGLDFVQYNVISWIVAKDKEKNKIKLFTIKKDKHIPDDIEEYTNITYNIQTIIPRLNKAIGKGFWRIFDIEEKRESIGSEIIIRLLNRIKEIKTLADEIHLLDSFSEREQKINEIINNIHQANTDEIATIQNTLLYQQQQEDAEQYWKESLSNKIWGKLGEDIQCYLKTGKSVYSFLESISIENPDWTAANVEFCKAIELELNQKFIAPFGKWLKYKQPMKLDLLLCSSDKLPTRDDWYKLLTEVDLSPIGESKHGIPLGSIRWSLLHLGQNTHSKKRPDKRYDRLFLLLTKYIGRSNDECRKFFYSLPNELNELIITRNNSLHTEFLERNKLDTFISKLQRLLPQVVNMIDLLPTIEDRQ